MNEKQTKMIEKFEEVFPMTSFIMKEARKSDDPEKFLRKRVVNLVSGIEDIEEIRLLLAYFVCKSDKVVMFSFFRWLEEESEDESWTKSLGTGNVSAVH